MPNFLVSGLINIETTVAVPEFPIEYSPVEYSFFGLDATVSGVGYNVAKALTTLGNRTSFLSVLGRDFAVASVRNELKSNYIDDQYILELAGQTARSIIFYDSEGQRKIIVDLKDIQDQRYPPDVVERQMIHADAAILCNVNFSRPMLSVAKNMHKLIATDVHAISDIESEYDSDFMQAADILFMSDALLPVEPEEWAKEVMAKYNPQVLVIGMGKKGALMTVRDDDFTGSFPSMDLRDIVNTIGAGDALFSAFVHNYVLTKDPYTSIKKAILFAGYKIGTRSASEGFLTGQRLDKIYSEQYPE